MASQTKQCPKDGLVIISMLKELGISNYEPRVVNQLLEFATRYVSCVLDDARAFANHSKKKTIDVDDIKLAVGMQMEKVFTTPPPRDLLLEVARSKNSIPLPLVKPHCGIRLPPDRHCFSACNYKLKSNTKKGPEKVKYNLSSSTGGLNQINSNVNNEPPLKIAKTSTGLSTGSVANNVNTSSVPVVKRTATNNVARSQAITAVAKQLIAKPIIKLTTNPVMTNSQQHQQSQQQQQQQQTQSQQVHAKARIQVTTSGVSNTGVSTAGSTNIGQQQTQSQHMQQSQPSPHQVEVKLEPSDNTSSSSSVLSTGEQLLGIKRKRDEEFGGLENHWRRLVIAVPQSSSSTYKVNRAKSMSWHSPKS